MMATVPMAGLFGYATALRSRTHGRATFTSRIPSRRLTSWCGAGPANRSHIRPTRQPLPAVAQRSPARV
jgi:hypothetical protein